MDVLTLNVGEMDFYMNPNTVYFMVPMLDNLSYAMTTSNTYFKKAPELTHDIDQEWFHDNFSNIIELTRQIQTMFPIPVIASGVRAQRTFYEP